MGHRRPPGLRHLALEGREGNARLWIQTTTVRVNTVHFYEDGLTIDHKRRGVGLAQRRIGNVVDLASSMGATTVGLDTTDIGGYAWARAGFVPRDWTSFALQVDARLRALQRSKGKMGEAEEATIQAMLLAGARDPRVVRSIAGRETEVMSTNRREPGDSARIAIGKQLLIGTNWNGELVLGDEGVDGDLRELEGEMGEGSAATREREIDTYAVSGARALRRAGWSDARIADAYGEMPPIHLSLAEILDHNARVGTKVRERAILDDESFQEDP